MYDLIVIGGGPGGYEAAARAGALGKKVLLIEEQTLGGTCLRVGCIPTKTWLKTAHLLAALKKTPELTGAVALDFAALQTRQKQIVAQLTAGIAAMLKKARVETVNARAKIVAPNRVEANGQTLATANILIAAGGQPARPPLAGLDLTIDSAEALNLPALPASLAVLGGGVIGLELASFFHAVGVPVTIIEMTKQIGGTLDGEIAKRLLLALKKSGINFYLESKVEKIEAGGDTRKITFANADGLHTVEAASVLAALGRTPRVAGLGLDEAGVAYDRRGVKTDAAGQTNVAGIWACGDVTGRCLLAHAATREGLIAVENMFGGDAKMRYDAMPAAVYTTPEVAMVGATEEQLKATPYQKITTPLAVAGRYAIEFPDETGVLKILLAPDTRQILGAHILGGNGGEWIHSLAMMMTWQIPADRLNEVIFPHPTIAEALAKFRV
ncbi:MAG: dihydrolipoyl dehydrogenase [Planctomycetota bacterium]|jgi:dihydrolipoamide dehydrogenase|nr:dihydrolipoyl dehydrogenase [Planctomycetota bacterium]